MKKVCLIVDNPLRDLDGMCLVAFQLSKQGIETYLVPFYQSYEVLFINPHAVVLNYIRPNNLKFVNSCRSIGIKTIVLDTEGAILQNVNEHFLNISKTIASNVDLYAVWGPTQANALKATGKLDPSKVFTSGSPRHDLCHSKYSLALHHDMKERLGRIVLVNTNFPILIPRFQSLEKEMENLINIHGWKRDYTEKWVEESRVAFEGIIDIVKRLSKKYSTIEFVLRPHPFENKNAYTKEFIGFENVHVLQEGSVLPWIQKSILVIHRNCSTAIESVFMGKIPVNISWPNLPTIRQPIPEKISLNVKTYDELEETVNRALQSEKIELPNEVKEAQVRFIEDLYLSKDGQSSNRFAAEVIKIISNTHDRPHKSFSSILIKLLTNKDYREIVRLLIIRTIGYNSFLKIKVRFKKIKYDFGKELHKEYIEYYIETLSKCESSENKVIRTTTTHVNQNKMVKYSILVSSN